jgi:hypothetical protein
MGGTDQGEDEGMKRPGWIGVDLDGTLAYYDHWRGIGHIGPPVPAMLERVVRWVEQGLDVRIFTARVGPGRNDMDAADAEYAIREWCREHLGAELAVTCVKDLDMLELWDDRAVAVEPNTGRPLNASMY